MSAFKHRFEVLTGAVVLAAVIALLPASSAMGATCDPYIQNLKAEKMAVRTALMGLLPTGSNSDDARIKQANKYLTKSLNNKYWVDTCHLTKYGQAVFHAEKRAVYNLKKVQSVNVSAERTALVGIDRQLASIAISEIPATAVNPKNQKSLDREKANALKKLAEGDAKQAQGKLEDAIQKYKDAWQRARKATDYANKP